MYAQDAYTQNFQQPPSFASQPSPTSQIDATCRFWQAGTCTRGTSCRFRHDMVNGPATSAPPPKSFDSHHGGGGGGGPPIDAPCRFFLAGRCAKGAGCRFRHDGEQQQQQVQQAGEGYYGGGAQNQSVGGMVQGYQQQQNGDLMEVDNGNQIQYRGWAQ